MPSSPIVAAVYARISDDTEGMAAGVTRQIEDSAALAQRLGWSLPLPPFVDNDLSASTRSKVRRPAFEELLKAVESGEVQAIAYYSSSRLTRRPAEFETIINLVERTGVALASVASGNADLTTADGRMIARFLAAQDAAEAERIGERVRRANTQRLASGKPHPSSRAFGFEKGGTIIRQDEAALIREAAHRVADEGWSLGMVVRDWNERQVPTLRGAKGWNGVQVSRALTGPRSAGLISDKGKIVGTFEGIISPALSARVQRALSDRKHGNAVTFKQRNNYLAGFLVCGKCGKPVKVNALYAEDGSLRKDSYVVCSRSQFGCGNVKRNLPILLEYMQDVIPDRLKKTWEPVEVEVVQEDPAPIEKELREIEEDLQACQAAFDAGEMRFADYNRSMSALRTRQETRAATLNALSEPRDAPLESSPLEAFLGTSVEEKRKVLAMLVDHIKLMPTGRVGPAKIRGMMPETTIIVWK